MKLVIVESPSKAKTISKYLGSDYSVIASAGHIVDLPAKSLGVDVSLDFKPRYVDVQGKEKIISDLQAKIKKADEIFLATDPDREGEAIAWHIKNRFNLDKDVNRIEFNEITKNSVKKAIEKPRKIDQDLVDAQQARRVLDRLVGYQVSPILGTKISKGLSAGRVQSVALKIVVDKEREIKSFNPKEYWTIYANISKENNKNTYKSLFIDINGKKTQIKNKEECEKILDGIKNGVLYVDDVKKQLQQKKPQPPFTTSTMQQDAVSKLNFSATKVSQLAQKLYEGIDIDGLGTTALVTYIRTDSTRVSKEAQQAARTYIINNYGNDYVPKNINNYETKKGAQDAHEAIRPISVDITPSDLKDKIDKDLYKLYKLIYERFMASQMSNAEYDTLTVHIVSDNNNTKYGFQLKGKSVRFEGYTAIYSETQIKEKEENEEDKEIKNLPQFNLNDKIILHELLNEQKFTKPPFRYTEASLIKKLEDLGIGRPSTYATIMQTLSKRDYTTKEKKFIVPTELGINVVDFLVKHFKDILDIKFTSNMENDLDKIADGKKYWIDVLKSFYPNFKEELNSAKYGNKVVTYTDIKCTKCNSRMIIKDGPFGKFLGCEKYPECKNIMNYGEPICNCPKCNSTIVKSLSKSKKYYYRCANKDCDFISFDFPASFLCPKCNKPVKFIKGQKENKYKCTDINCDFEKVEVIKNENSNN